MNRYLRAGLIAGATLLAASAVGAREPKRGETRQPQISAPSPSAPSERGPPPATHRSPPSSDSARPPSARLPPRDRGSREHRSPQEDGRFRERLPRAPAIPPVVGGDRRPGDCLTDPPRQQYVPRRHLSRHLPGLHPPSPYVPPYPWWRHWGGHHDDFRDHWWFGWCWEAPWVYNHYYTEGTLAYEFDIPAPLGYDEARVLYLERAGRDTIRVELVDLPDASHDGIEVVVLRDDGADGTLEQAVRTYGRTRSDALARYWRGDDRGYGIELPGAERLYSLVLYDQILDRLDDVARTSRR